MNIQLEVIEGHFEGERFIMKGIGGYDISGTYKANGLLSMARLIDDDEPFSFYMGNDKSVFVPVELNKQIRKELFLIAEALEKGLV